MSAAKNISRKLLLTAVFFIIWTGVISVFQIRPIYLPGPKDIINSFIAMRASLPSSILSSLRITLSGFLIGAVIGVGMGLLMEC